MYFVTKNGPNFLTNGKDKNIFIVIFIVFWSRLFTTKFRCLQKKKSGHTKVSTKFIHSLLTCHAFSLGNS